MHKLKNGEVIYETDPGYEEIMEEMRAYQIARRTPMAISSPGVKFRKVVPSMCCAVCGQRTDDPTKLCKHLKYEDDCDDGYWKPPLKDDRCENCRFSSVGLSDIKGKLWCVLTDDSEKHKDINHSCREHSPSREEIKRRALVNKNK